MLANKSTVLLFHHLPSDPCNLDSYSQPKHASSLFRRVFSFCFEHLKHSNHLPVITIDRCLPVGVLGWSMTYKFYPLIMTNIAMEHYHKNSAFFSIKHGDFPQLCSITRGLNPLNHHFPMVFLLDYPKVHPFDGRQQSRRSRLGSGEDPEISAAKWLCCSQAMIAMGRCVKMPRSWDCLW